MAYNDLLEKDDFFTLKMNIWQFYVYGTIKILYKKILLGNPIMPYLAYCVGN
jgi:hypothetical protein